MSEAEHHDEGEPFATKLRRLFDSIRREDGTKYTPREVAAELTERGHRVSKSYIYALLKAESEPSHALVQALADFFDVSLDYFSNSERGRWLNEQYAVLEALGESEVRELALRASQLSPESLRSVLAFIDFEVARNRSDDHSSE